jgi:hypothetical protein
MGALFKSSASTAQSSSQTTNQQDNRIVNGDGAVAFSNSNGNSISSTSSTDSHNITNYTTTDFGAVQGSYVVSLVLSLSNRQVQKNRGNTSKSKLLKIPALPPDLVDII